MMPRSIVSLLWVIGLLTIQQSSAAYERQWRVGGGLGLATLQGAGLGAAIDTHGAYGLSDMFDVHIELLGSRHTRETDFNVLSASTGVSYKIDVLQWIPYVILMGGVYHYGGEGGPNGERGIEPGASVGGGLDYLFSRDLAVGAQLRQHASFTDGLSFPYFSATLRAEYRWGW
jgi:hypothetical protein